jgi:hypothetical protein
MTVALQLQRTKRYSAYAASRVCSARQAGAAELPFIPRLKLSQLARGAVHKEFLTLLRRHSFVVLEDDSGRHVFNALYIPQLPRCSA